MLNVLLGASYVICVCALLYGVYHVVSMPRFSRRQYPHDLRAQNDADPAPGVSIPHGRKF